MALTPETVTTVLQELVSAAESRDMAHVRQLVDEIDRRFGSNEAQTQVGYPAVQKLVEDLAPLWDALAANNAEGAIVASKAALASWVGE